MLIKSMWYGSDWNIFQIISSLFIQFIELCCITNVFIAAKFVVIILSCFYKYETWLHQITLFLFEFQTTERDEVYADSNI